MQLNPQGKSSRTCAWLAGWASLLVVAPGAEAQGQPKLFQSEVQPVRATMKASRMEASPGDSLEVVVQVRINKGWHVYAADGTNSQFIPATVKLTLPKGLEAAGDWTNWPAAVRSKEGALIYTNAVAFHRVLKVKPDAPLKTLVIGGEMRFQACDDQACFPPNTLAFESPVLIAEKTNLPPATK